MKKFIVTIDGPMASGKSTAAQALAQNLGAYYINSGLLYRALAYLLMECAGYTIEQLAHPDAKDMQIYFDPIRCVYSYTQGSARIFFDEKDITPFLKTPLIDQAASILSTNHKVRQILLDFQRNLALKHDIVVDGRDAGSVIFPNAQVKFYVTASLEVRAQRWLATQTGAFNFEQACHEILERDTRDMSRDIAPLVVPNDAIILDTSLLTPEQTIAALLEQVQRVRS